MAAATTTQDQINAQNNAATATANQSVLGTQQAPAMSTTSQPGIIAGGMSKPMGDLVAQHGSATQMYNGQEVVSDPLLKENIIASSKIHNAAVRPDQQLTPEEYDKWLNPTTYGSRWGVAPSPALTDPSKATLTGPASQATGYAPAQLGAATQWNVTPEQTVSNQMQKMADPNNPYYQQWATAGAQDAAARGFTGNSSIRSTGILDSVMRNALPVAQSDASTYSKAAGYNADQANQFAQFNATAQNTAGQFNAGQANNTAIAKLQSETTKYGADVSAGTQRYVSDQSAATQQAIAKMSNSSQQTISQLHDANSVLLQNNQSAQAAYNAYVNAVANIDIQPSMDAAAKQAAIITQTQIFNSTIAGLKGATPGTPDVSSPLSITPAVAQAGGVDVSSQLNFDYTGG